MQHAENDDAHLRRLVEAMRREAERNEALLNAFFSAELHLVACNRLRDLFDYLFHGFRMAFNLDAVTLLLLDPDETARQLLLEPLPLADATQPEPVPDYEYLRLLEHPALLDALHPKHRLFCGEPTDFTLHTAFPKQTGIRSCALLPLVRENQLLGSLGLGSQDPERFNYRLGYEYVTHLASVVGLCIEGCISRETLQRLSRVDTLTQVYNRRELTARLHDELRRSLRTGLPLTFLLADVDFFKRVNDQYGHLSGDRVLQGVAQCLRTHTRATDCVARYGGEEFAILLPGSDQTTALRVAEKIRLAIADAVFTGQQNESIPVTASFGLATLNPQGHSIHEWSHLAESLTQCADEALYYSKAHGRNQSRAVLYPDCD